VLTPTLTRDQVTALLHCTHTELGQLLREKRAPLPVRVAGVALWFEDEVTHFKEGAAKILAKRRARKERR
jgi:hypothetical protein